jgi:hypothetical protein
VSTQTRTPAHPSNLCVGCWMRPPAGGWATCAPCFFRPVQWSDTTRGDVWWRAARRRWGLTDVPADTAVEHNTDNDGERS